MRDHCLSEMTVYIDHAFAAGDWGRWSGGGHLQADTAEELHAFAERLGLRREWFQSKPARPENDHYDLGRVGRERALELGAVAEDRQAGTRRRQTMRRARRATDGSTVTSGGSTLEVQPPTRTAPSRRPTR
jgi:hypothetical protein